MSIILVVAGDCEISNTTITCQYAIKNEILSLTIKVMPCDLKAEVEVIIKGKKASKEIPVEANIPLIKIDGIGDLVVINAKLHQGHPNRLSLTVIIFIQW